MVDKRKVQDKHGTWVEFEDSPEMHKKVFDFLIENYYKKHGFLGEILMQDDKALISGPEVLADIADDVICFEVEED
jgi:hypothetical protein